MPPHSSFEDRCVGIGHVERRDPRVEGLTVGLGGGVLIDVDAVSAPVLECGDGLEVARLRGIVLRPFRVRRSVCEKARSRVSRAKAAWRSNVSGVQSPLNKGSSDAVSPFLPHRAGAHSACQQPLTLRRESKAHARSLFRLIVGPHSTIEPGHEYLPPRMPP